MFCVSFDGKMVRLPFEFDFAETVRGRLPDGVSLSIDERDFGNLFGRHAAWVSGTGPYASLAYCGVLTIQRYATLERAIEAKKVIDSTGCGGGCARVHILIHCDPANSEHEAEQARIREYVARNEG